MVVLSWALTAPISNLAVKVKKQYTISERVTSQFHYAHPNELSPLPPLLSSCARPLLSDTLWVAGLQVSMSIEDTAVASDHRGRRKAPGLLKRIAAAFSRRRNGMTGHSVGSMFVTPLSPGGAATVAAIDFSAWLQHAVRPENYVVLHMDIAGAEFEVRRRSDTHAALLLVTQMLARFKAQYG